jgi:hypothetical protein
VATRWKKEECRVRYVQGEPISLKALALEANYSFSVLSTISYREGWVAQRKEYQRKLDEITLAKTLDKTSDLRSDRLVVVNEQHIESLTKTRLTAESFLTTLIMSLRDLPQGDRAARLVDSQFSLAVQRYSNTILNSIQVERIALGLKYLDVDVAVNELVKAGFEVSVEEDK